MWRYQDDYDLDPLADGDGSAAAGLDRAGQQPVAGGLFGALVQPDTAVLQFFGTEFLYRLAQLRVGRAGGFELLQGLELRGVMRVDRFLDRHRARHGRLLAERRGDRTEGKT